ncbi:hypothetical protein J2T47_002352 [Pseudomonas nitroreducens]|nr:hypothetical protein [Pseudomonas nitroreducens]
MRLHFFITFICQFEAPLQSTQEAPQDHSPR